METILPGSGVISDTVESCKMFRDGLEVRDNGVSHVHQGRDTLLSGLRVPCPASVANKNRDNSQIGGVTARRLDADLDGNANDDKTTDATVSQSELEGCALKGRHRQLVEDDFAGQRSEFRNKLERWRVAKKRGGNLGGALLALPGHRHPVLEGTHHLRWERHVAREDRADPSITCSL